MTTQLIGSAATHPSLRGTLATKQSRGRDLLHGASNPDGRTPAPVEYFASFAMTDRELAHLFCVSPRRRLGTTASSGRNPANMCHPRESVACAGDASEVEGSRFNR